MMTIWHIAPSMSREAVKLRKRGYSLKEFSKRFWRCKKHHRVVDGRCGNGWRGWAAIIYSNKTWTIICAMIYWCEGGKNAKYSVAFTNSDPKLVRTFLKLLRECFVLDESKFHPCIHLHSYHLPEKQLDFWSKVTDINKQQFIKPYLKPNTGKRIHENYQGCISLRYFNNDLAQQLVAIAKAYLSQ